MAAAAALLSAVAPTTARAQTAEEAGLRAAYAADVFGNVSGGFDREVTAVHRLDVGYDADLGSGWTLSGTVSGTVGPSLSERAIGDVQGVQGAYSGGDALWLYELYLTRRYDGGRISFGRMSSGEAFSTVGSMGEFVNSAFSSNGGAISVNTPGRLPSPASSWGVLAEHQFAGLQVRGGAFLSDPSRANADRTADLSFRPGDGVLGFAEVIAEPSEGVQVGAGVWADSGRFDTFTGQTRHGNQGAYAFVTGRLMGETEGRRLEGFAMVQVAPRDDRSLMPLAAFGGLTLREPFAGRPNDSASIGIASGRFSDDSGLSGAETTIEAHYSYALTEQITVRPDAQYVINPGGLFRDALVLGVHLEAEL